MPNVGKIPFLDLVGLHQELENELTSVFQKALRTAGFVGGPMVEEFEREFARFCDAAHCVGLASGTDAVRFALMAAGILPGDIVLTVPHTFIATTEAISQAGARPDFVDIDERTYCMDAEKLQEYIERECYVDRETGKPYHRKWRMPVTGVVPVHIYGQMADMGPILELARRYHLIVIEDACQAHGAEYFSKKENRWRKAGSLSQAAAFSFYPGKNLGDVYKRQQRTSLSASYSHGVSGGSGVFAGSLADTVSGSAVRQLSRVSTGSLNAGYSRNTGLSSNESLQIPQSNQPFDYWFAGANYSRLWGRSLNMNVGYQLQYQNSDSSFCTGTGCGSSFVRNLITFSVGWRKRPIPIE